MKTISEGGIHETQHEHVWTIFSQKIAVYSFEVNCTRCLLSLLLSNYFIIIHSKHSCFNMYLVIHSVWNLKFAIPYIEFSVKLFNTKTLLSILNIKSTYYRKIMLKLIVHILLVSEINHCVNFGILKYIICTIIMESLLSITQMIIVICWYWITVDSEFGIHNERLYTWDQCLNGN